jgi:hypothetical protein
MRGTVLIYDNAFRYSTSGHSMAAATSNIHRALEVMFAAAQRRDFSSTSLAIAASHACDDTFR